MQVITRAAAWSYKLVELSVLRPKHRDNIRIYTAAGNDLHGKNQGIRITAYNKHITSKKSRRRNRGRVLYSIYLLYYSI
jgi:hypothetical protein